MNCTFRQAVETDLPGINEIYNMAVNHGGATADLFPVTLFKRKCWFEDHLKHGNPILVADVDGFVVGWLSFSFYRGGRAALKHVREISYYIHPDFWGAGIASRLIKHSLSIASEMDIEVLLTFIIDGNEGSIRLMEKFDFQQWGCFPSIVHMSDGQIRDHLVFGRKIKKNM